MTFFTFVVGAFLYYLHVNLECFFTSLKIILLSLVETTLRVVIYSSSVNMKSGDLVKHRLQVWLAVLGAAPAPHQPRRCSEEQHTEVA